MNGLQKCESVMRTPAADPIMELDKFCSSFCQQHVIYRITVFLEERRPIFELEIHLVGAFRKL